MTAATSRTDAARDDQPPAPLHDVTLRFVTERQLRQRDGIERWTVEALVSDSARADVARVGQLNLVAIDLMRTVDPWAALDSSNDDLAHIGDTVFDMNTGQLSETLDSRIPRNGNRLLILDRVELEPDWQGHNVAAVLVAECLDQLRTGCRVALCLPAPLERRPDETDEEYTASVERMRHVWSQVGFRPFLDGVWLLEPNSGALDDSLRSLRSRHGLTA
jgi:GNAT superfamily N-acetyltransferase